MRHFGLRRQQLASPLLKLSRPELLGLYGGPTRKNHSSSKRPTFPYNEQKIPLSRAAQEYWPFPYQRAAKYTQTSKAGMKLAIFPLFF